MKGILDYVLNNNTDEECSGSILDGESDGSDNIDYGWDVEVQHMFVQPVQEIIDNDVTLDDNDILLTLINNNKLKLLEKEVQLLVMAVEILLLILMILVILKVITMMVLAYNKHQCQHLHTGRVCNCEGASVHGFTKARQDVSGKRVCVCDGRQGHNGQCSARQGNGNGKVMIGNGKV